MINHALVQGGAVSAGETYRLLSLVCKAFLVKAILTVGTWLWLDRASMFLWVQRLPTHLAIECIAPQLT